MLHTLPNSLKGTKVDHSIISMTLLYTKLTLKTVLFHDIKLYTKGKKKKTIRKKSKKFRSIKLNLPIQRKNLLQFINIPKIDLKIKEKK